jgi:hypothetical protein
MLMIMFQDIVEAEVVQVLIQINIHNTSKILDVQLEEEGSEDKTFESLCWKLSRFNLVLGL